MAALGQTWVPGNDITAMPAALANFAGMFTTAQVKTFPRDQVDAARAWLARA